jgi:hypothetical protein
LRSYQDGLQDPKWRIGWLMIRTGNGVLFPYAGDATIQDLPKPARALPVPPKSASREKKKGKEENKKWSFGDFTSMGSLSSPSTPGTRTSSPERKGRSRQPRRLAEAVSLALGSGSRDITASHSRSGRGSGLDPSQPFLGCLDYIRNGPWWVAADEVLDIRMPSFEGKDEPRRTATPCLFLWIFGYTSFRQLPDTDSPEHRSS